jgi:ribonuclease HI
LNLKHQNHKTCQQNQKSEKIEEIYMPRKIMIFSDGGARGNPGPAAIAFLIISEKGRVLVTNSKYIGPHTNNQAEYKALITALQSAMVFQAEEVICHLDSELVVKQIIGEYSVKNKELRKLWSKVKEIAMDFKEINFISVPRENIQIQKADALVNKALDEYSRNKGLKSSENSP